MLGVYPKSGRGKGFVLPLQMCMTHPVINIAKDKKESIINNTKSIFVVDEKSIPNVKIPFHEICTQNTVALYNNIIKIEAFRQDIDPDLIRAIMYIETSHGWYDRFYPWRSTILPMNIHYQYWKGLGFNKSQLQIPKNNIHVGTLLIKRIQDRLKDPKIYKIASVYNILGKENISEHGVQVANIYKNKSWEKC